MLRIFRRSIWTGGAHKVATTNPRVPSVKTTIKLNNLPASITQQSLRNHFKSTSNIRSIDIEPGCVVYFRNEADADIFKKQLLSKTKYEIRISSVLIPSLLISHVPFDVISSNISDQLPVGTPQLIKHIGGSLIQINVRGSEHVITIVEALKSLHAELKISSLDVDVVKLPSGSFVISLPVLISLSDAKLNEMQSLIAKSVPLESLESFKVDKGARSVLVRLTGNVKDADAIVKEALPGVPFKIAPLARPAVIVRKLDQFAPEDVQGILGSVGATRVQYLSRGRDLVPNTAVLYFNSETDALEALKKIDSEELPVALAEVDEDLDDIDETGELGEVDVDDEEELIRAGEGEGEGIEGAENEGVEAIGDEAMEGEMTDELMEQGDDEDFIMEKIPASYRLFEEPGVCISNVAKCRLTLSELTELLSPHEASDVSVEGDKCYAVLPSKKHVDLLLSSLPRQTFNGTKLIAEQHNRVDTGIEIQLADTDLQSISRAFQNVAGLVVASIAEITNKSISFGYLTRNDVETAKFSFLKQRISLGPQGSAPISADVSAVPAFAVEVSGLGVETSVSKLLESIPSKTDPIKVDRTAIIKVKRNQDVLPTLKKLKSTSIDGFKLSPVRYRGFSGEVSANRTEYDEFSDESDEIFDKFALRKLLKDYLHADPAIRYQIGIFL